MKRLYIGNTTSDTDRLVTELATQNNTVNHGLITRASDIVEDGFYHSTVVDITPAEIAKLACDILLLDQPKESFSTTKEYHDTQQLVNSNNTHWQQ
jgi:hypothetical protein